MNGTSEKCRPQVSQIGKLAGPDRIAMEPRLLMERFFGQVHRLTTEIHESQTSCQACDRCIQRLRSTKEIGGAAGALRRLPGHHILARDREEEPEEQGRLLLLCRW